MTDLIIFGTGPIAKLAHYYFIHDSDFHVRAFTVDKQYINRPTFLSLPVIDFETVNQYYPPEKNKMFIALSYTNQNQSRSDKYFLAKKKGYHLASYISSKATYFPNVLFGDNCFILENNTLQPFVKIGNNVTLWSGNHIGHDTVIEDHCFVASQAVISGFVRIMPYCFIGVNATIRNSVVVAPRTIIGAGAVIMKNTEENSVYTPPKTIKLNKSSKQVKL